MLVKRTFGVTYPSGMSDKDYTNITTDWLEGMLDALKKENINFVFADRPCVKQVSFEECDNETISVTYEFKYHV